MPSPTLIELFRYPVKSMMGESLTETEVTEAGITGDRIWAVRDETRGGIRGGKKIPQLMTLGALLALMLRGLPPPTAIRPPPIRKILTSGCLTS